MFSRYENMSSIFFCPECKCFLDLPLTWQPEIEWARTQLTRALAALTQPLSVLAEPRTICRTRPVECRRSPTALSLCDFRGGPRGSHMPMEHCRDQAGVPHTPSQLPGALTWNPRDQPVHIPIT